MDGELSFESLRRVHLAEKNSPGLSSLDGEFYLRYRGYTEQLKHSLSAQFTLESAHAYESTRKLLSDISHRRQQKIFLKSLHDFHAGTVSSEGLAAEEQELYTSLLTILTSCEAKLAGETTLRPAPLSDQVATVAADVVTVQLLADVPQFVGATGPIGPFSAQQKANLSKVDAQLLAEQGIAHVI